MSIYRRIGVGGGDDDPGDASGDQSVGARAGASVMRTRLQRDISGRAAGQFAGFAQGDDLGVVAVVIFMKARADQSFPSRTITQPTVGFGEASPMPCRARSSAWAIQRSSTRDCLDASHRAATPQTHRCRRAAGRRSSRRRRRSGRVDSARGRWRWRCRPSRCRRAW